MSASDLPVISVIVPVSYRTGHYTTLVEGWLTRPAQTHFAPTRAVTTCYSRIQAPQTTITHLSLFDLSSHAAKLRRQLQHRDPFNPPLLGSIDNHTCLSPSPWLRFRSRPFTGTPSYCTWHPQPSSHQSSPPNLVAIKRC